MRPPSQLLRKVAEAQAKVFSTMPLQPEGSAPGLRTGAKYLRQRLVGPSMLNYYPPAVNMRPISKQLFGPGGPLDGMAWKAPDGSLRRHIVDPKEFQRLADVERKRKLGKGPPKKGEGRRASMKGKGKR